MPPHLILASIFSFVAVGAYAGEWANLGTTSTTEPAHLCDIVVSPGGHHDIDCSGNNPEIIANGAISATGISTTSLFVNGTEITGGGGGGGSADQVISGTTNITTNENSSISFTTAGTERMILTDSGQLALGEGTADPSAILDISTTTQGVLPPRLTTAQRDNISNPAEGLMIFNAEQGAYQFWASSNWVDLGAGMPNGAIAAFASSSCPSGWSEYTPARGRFLRGIDPTGTLDPDGVRTPGSTQADMIESHQHTSPYTHNPSSSPYGDLGGQDSGVSREVTDSSEGSDIQSYTSSYGGAETRPVNVAVTFCQYDGGAQLVATPSGSAGEVQFADGSGGLSSNANFIYTGGNLGVNTAAPQTTLEVGGTISTSSLFVNGTEITGGGSGGGSINFEDFAEQSPDPANPAADTMRLFARDDGSGNTELVAVDSTGSEFYISSPNKIIAEGSFSGVSQLDVRLDDEAWDEVEIIFSGLQADVQGPDFEALFQQSGSFLTGSTDYSYSLAWGSGHRNDNEDSRIIILRGVEEYPERNNDTSIKIRLIKPQQANMRKSIFWEGLYADESSNTMFAINGGGHLMRNQDPIDAVRFQFTSGNMTGYYTAIGKRYAR